MKRKNISKASKNNQNLLFKLPWFWMAIAFLFISSLLLRFWGLARFNKYVFDEVYYVKYAKNYLNHLPFFDVHPPLGKYLIALGIWFSNLPFFDPNGQVTPFDYRCTNATIGSFVPLIVAGIAYQLSHRRSYAFLAGLFTSADGLLLVESRYAFLNIYLIFFGVLAQFCFLIAINNQSFLRHFYLLLSGIFFGACTSVKWYGLGFIAGIYGVWIVIKLLRWWNNLSDDYIAQAELKQTQLWINLSRFNGWFLILYLGILPIIIYCSIWIPHLQLYPDRTLIKLHQDSWAFHQQLGNDSKVHPYCSSWYSWVLMIRPVAYLYEKVKTPSKQTIIYDVHAIGNPILWWLAAIAIVILIVFLLQKLIKRQIHPEWGIPAYILCNYGANWLPWMLVHRCAFISYYMPASIFGFLAIAYLVDRYLNARDRRWQAVGVTIIFAILASFAYWLPIYLALPLSSEEFARRMLFPSWY
jgi:dolichyl-phosphate-mannose-protein mannosyltransferase